MNLFTKPTLVTITAPTCAGKSFLLEALVNSGFERVVSTTDRAPRAGEIDGVHYHFMSTERSKEFEANNMFAEIVTYSGVRYGVTHAEMNRKMVGDKPPMVILEPQGLEIYKSYCASRGWDVFSIYVQTPESIRLERLADRTTVDLMVAAMGAHSIEESFHKVVAANNKRLQAIIEQERLWLTKNSWNAIVDGTDLESALQSIKQGIKAFNAKADIRS